MAPEDLPLLVERYNAGEPIPPVHRDDIRAALQLLNEVHEIVQRAREGAVPVQRAPGFVLEDLAERCRPGAEIFAVAIRGVLVEAILREDLNVEPSKREVLIDAAATASLFASDLGGMDSLRRRLDQL